MKLIKFHKPKSKEELYQLIKYHYENSCTCGIRSVGTIEDFGKNLYESQLKEWGKYKYSLQECIQWEYDLFIVQSLKGTAVENEALGALKVSLGESYEVSVAEGFVDEELRIDLIVSKNGDEICGIQVKPHTFNYMREGVKAFNLTANQKWGKPVYYLYYDEKEEFQNMHDILAKIIDQ